MFLKVFVIIAHLWIPLQAANDSLVLVHVLVRHCERTPDKSELYPTSPYWNNTFAPYGNGQLTNEGKNNCYEIGKALRRRYNGFLSPTYHYTLVEGQSTDFIRTKETLQLILAGLFPPTDEIMWLPGFNWVPIATNYVKDGEDKVLFPLHTSFHKTEFAKFCLSEEGKAYDTPFRDVMKIVSKQTGKPVDLLGLAYIARGFVLLDGLGFDLPDWVKPYYPYPIQNTTSQIFQKVVGNRKLKRIFSGFCLRKIVQDTEMKINGTLNPMDRKIFIYAGHDFNIMTLLNVLDVWKNDAPSVGAYCILEVHNINGTHGFKLYYSNSSKAEPVLIPVTGFNDFVPLDEFKIRYKDFIELDDLEGSSKSSRTASTTIIVLTLFILYSVFSNVIV